jgi:MFS family permease
VTADGHPHSRGLHYGWVVLVVSTLTVLGCIGFARFGYTMILPDMQAALDLSNTQTGALATGNFIGYLVLAVIGGVIASRYGPRRVIGVSMLLTGVTMALTGLANSFQGALVWRALTGLGSGGSNVPVMALLPAWFATRRRGLATGIAVSGASLALMITGPLVPHILDAFGEDGWRYSWFILGGLVLLLGLLAFALLRDRPEEKGLQPIAAEAACVLPVGTDEPAPQVVRPGSPQVVRPGSPQAVRPGSPQAARASSLDWGRVYRSGAVWHLALVYIAFGFSYVIYGTFFAKYLQAEGGYTKEAAGNLWAIVGWISVFCGLIWGTVSDLIGRKYGLALVYLTQAVSYAVFALWQSSTGYTVSVILFGLTAWSIPSIVAAACGDYLGARMAPAALGFVTLFFGVGQAAGPSVAGALADATGSFAPAFLTAAGVAFLGGVGSLLLRPPRISSHQSVASSQ